MKNRARVISVAFLNIIFFSLLIIIHNTGGILPEGFRANTISVLPLLIAFSMFNKEWVSTVTGMVAGFFMDSVTAQTSSFHTIIFMIIALFVSFSVKYLFNNNFKTSIMLSITLSIFYFLMRWLFFHAFTSSAQDSVLYFMYYAMPSILFTSIFIIPFFFLQKKLDQIKIG